MRKNAAATAVNVPSHLLPAKLVGQVHARMPVILPPEVYDLWLDPTLEAPEVLQPLLKPAPGAEWEGYPVGYYTRDDRPELSERK